MLTSSRCLLGTMKMFRFCTACLLLSGGVPVGQGQARGAEVPRCPVEHFCMRHEARVAAPCTRLRLVTVMMNLVVVSNGLKSPAEVPSYF